MQTTYGLPANWASNRNLIEVTEIYPLERFLLRVATPVRLLGHGLTMKIYMLMMLIGVIVGLSYLPLPIRVKRAATVRQDSLAA